MHLTKEELEKVRELQLQNTQITYELGEISLKLIEAKSQLSLIEKEQEDLHLEYIKNYNEGDELFKQLKDKYGEGSINLDTGEITNSK
jgi:hypothetical protein